MLLWRSAPPLYVVRPRGGLVLFHQLLHNLPGAGVSSTVNLSLTSPHTTEWDHLETSSSDRSSLNMASFLNCSRNACLLRNLSYCLAVLSNSCRPDHHCQPRPQSPTPAHAHPLTDEMLVWLASISPLTRCAVGMYGDLRERAT